jgi:hypothetical protein
VIHLSYFFLLDDSSNRGINHRILVFSVRLIGETDYATLGTGIESKEPDYDEDKVQVEEKQEQEEGQGNYKSSFLFLDDTLMKK